MYIITYLIEKVNKYRKELQKDIVMKIKKITKIGNADVYNMEVEKYHNYILDNGMVIKNCDAIRYFVAGRPYPSVRSEEGNRSAYEDDNDSYQSFFDYGR